MSNRFALVVVVAVLGVLVLTQPGRPQDSVKPRKLAGPLRVHPSNPRYFTDGTKCPDGSLRAVYLTGSHTWDNLVDMRQGDTSPGFDFDAYLDFLQRHRHNFIRLWAWDSSTWDTRANGALGKDFIHQVSRSRGRAPGRATLVTESPSSICTSSMPRTSIVSAPGSRPPRSAASTSRSCSSKAGG
jgi:hypothetical protein